MSTLVAQTISNGSISTSTANVINGAKAWVRFNGSGGATINASYNVSSVTRNGTGDYTVNFTNAFVDANYAVAHTAGVRAVNWGIHLRNNGTAPTTTAYRFWNVTPSDVAEDQPFNNLSFFR